MRFLGTAGALCSLLLQVSVSNAKSFPKRTVPANHNASEEWTIEQFSNLLTFGDSYTDENRLNYFILNNGTAPPAGTFLPQV